MGEGSWEGVDVLDLLHLIALIFDKCCYLHIA